MHVLTFLLTILLGGARAEVAPMLHTEWGQADPWWSEAPVDARGESTYLGCTTVALAQVLYHYRYQAQLSGPVSYALDNPVDGPDIVDGVLARDADTVHEWAAMAHTEAESDARVDATAAFLYEVGASLHAQFGDVSGSPATARLLENAVRYQWGYRHKSRRSMTIISKEAFGYDDDEWAALIRGELDAGRPVLVMAEQQEGTAGHAFVFDGWREDGTVHVNFGWSGRDDGWVDPNVVEDGSGRRWSRSPMLFLGLEPEDGYAAAQHRTDSSELQWTGNGSLVSFSSGDRTGYGLTQDEAAVRADAGERPVVFFQWELDQTDGTRLVVDADFAETATLRLGDWEDRSGDRVFTDVSLPAVIDPAAEGFDISDGRFLVVAVAPDTPDGADGVVTAATTHAEPTATSRAAVSPLVVDGHLWSGSGSVIGWSSEHAEGYGLTHDLLHLAAGSQPPTATAQWEVDPRDGDRLFIDLDGHSGSVSWGPWDGDRSDDTVTRIDGAAALEVSAEDLGEGSWVVLRVSLEQPLDSPASLVLEVR